MSHDPAVRVATHSPLLRQRRPTLGDSLVVETGDIRARGNVTISLPPGRKEPPRWDRWSLRRWCFTLAATTSLMALALLALPNSRAVPLDLQVETGYLRFQLSEDQPVLRSFSVAALTALDLAEIRMPGEEEPRVIRRDPESRRLNLEVEVLPSSSDGRLTLQEDFLPAGSRVEVRHLESGGAQLSVDRSAGSFSISTRGRYRYRFLNAGQPPTPWIERRAQVPEAFQMSPRRSGLSLLFRTEEDHEQKLADSATIDRLWLHEWEVLNHGDDTRLVERYQVRSAEIQWGSGRESLTLGRGSELRLEEPRGRITELASRNGLLRLRFQGTAAGVLRGPRDHASQLLPQPSRLRSIAFHSSAVLALASLALGMSLSLKSSTLRERSLHQPPGGNS